MHSSPVKRLDVPSDEALAGLAEGLRITALRILGDADDAADAAQEAIIRLIAALETSGIPAGYTLEAYAYGTLKHVTSDVQRRKRRFRLLPSWLGSTDPSPLDTLGRREEIAAVERSLQHLDPSDRKLLECCYVDGDKVADIARRTGEPPERIRKRKSRALARLRSLLRAQGHIPDMPND